MYWIAQAAQRSGLSIDTLRYYERIDLLDPPARDTGGRRVYSDSDLAWLEFLTKLRLTGMPIRMMREYTQLRREGEISAVRRRAILVEQRQSVLGRIAELQSCLDLLDHKIVNYDRICGDAISGEQTREELSA